MDTYAFIYYVHNKCSKMSLLKKTTPGHIVFKHPQYGIFNTTGPFSRHWLTARSRDQHADTRLLLSRWRWRSPFTNNVSGFGPFHSRSLMSYVWILRSTNGRKLVQVNIPAQISAQQLPTQQEPAPGDLATGDWKGPGKNDLLLALGIFYKSSLQ